MHAKKTSKHLPAQPLKPGTYAAMGDAELRKIASLAQRQLAQRVLDRTSQLRKDHAALLSRITQAMAPYGITANEFLTLPKMKLRRAIVAALQGESSSPLTPPYRHPENPELTWSGRGARPKWLRSLLLKGHALDEFRSTSPK